MSTEHAPTPWDVKCEDSIWSGYEWVADTGNAANAEFIVRAVNSHDDLICALKVLRGFMPPSGDDNIDAALNLADAALAKAEGRS
jgi:hypothetical protein